MGVFFEIESSLIKEVVKAVSNFNEESIFIFDSDGLFVRLSDLNRFKILELSLKSDDFLSYSCDAPVELGIIIERIWDVTKTLKNKDILSFSYEASSDVIVLKANGLTRQIKLIDAKLLSRVPSLIVSYDYSATIVSKQIKDFLKACGKSLMFNVSIQGGKLNFNCETEGGLIELNLDGEDCSLHPLEYEGENTYTIAEVNSALATAKNHLYLKGGSEGILQYSWDVSQNSNCKAFIARRG
jgi:DNA polymerase III sliding clamp (beta) subunit (PCNA family)|tara:strand:- start:337 stop:1059 length:723 start_codon:yes stop_codon:yes gene_type:complete